MLVNLKNYSTNNQPCFRKSYDFCIIGAGAAGITLALELEKYNFNIALCEAGDLRQTLESNNCYKGKVIGDYYMPLEERRLRFLGGTTNHWGGWSYPLDSIDFNRGYINKNFIWPINKEDIAPYLSKACEYLDLVNNWGENNYEHPFIKGEKADNLFLRDYSSVNKFDFQWSGGYGNEPARFGKKFFKSLKESKKIDVFLNANLTELNGVNNNINEVVVCNYSGVKFNISANKFIFAMGGIENSRFLLWFSKLYGGKFFDENLPIGKYWMDHPHHNIGNALLHKDIGERSFFRISDELQIKYKILNFGLRAVNYIDHKAKYLINSLTRTSLNLGKEFEKEYIAGNIKPYLIRGAWEQQPLERNEITLSDNEKDHFGIPRVTIYYKKNERDRYTMQKSMMIFSEWIIKNGLGRIKLDDWVVNKTEYPKTFFQGHHMGGTRMHDSRKFGVVDKNCKVYGSQNLYIIGSSIFTTGGQTNPTLSIIQLTLRLANHLKSNFT